MSFSGNDFQVLDALDSGDISTQRQLSDHSGICLGQINYVLRRLLEKGLVKNIILDEALRLRLVGHLDRVDGLGRLAPGAFDAVLLFDANAESPDGITRKSGAPRDKLKMLW